MQTDITGRRGDAAGAAAATAAMCVKEEDAASASAAAAAMCVNEEGVPDPSPGDDRLGEGGERSWCCELAGGCKQMPEFATRESQVAAAMVAADIKPSKTANHAEVFKVCLNKAVTEDLSNQECDTLKVFHNFLYISQDSKKYCAQYFSISTSGYQEKIICTFQHHKRHC